MEKLQKIVYIRRKIYMFKKLNIIIECELSLTIKDDELLEDKLKELGITKFKLIDVEDKGTTLVDLRAMEMLK